MVLREVFFGNGRFEAMKNRLGAADNVLSKRLGWLVEAGLLGQRPYDDGGRPRREYVLTAKGEDVLPVLNAVVLWSEKHLDAPNDLAHMTVIHNACGLPTSSADICTHCGERLTAASTSWHTRTRSEQPIPLATAPVTPVREAVARVVSARIVPQRRAMQGPVLHGPVLQGPAR